MEWLIGFGIAYVAIGLVFLSIFVFMFIYILIRALKMQKEFDTEWNSRKVSRW